MEEEILIQENENTAIIAMIIEIIFGFGGALGMGWLYVGNFGRAALIFTGYLVFCVIEAIIGVITIGMAAFCFAPLNILIIAFSSVKLRDRIRQTGATGSFLYMLIAFILFIALVIILIAVIIFFVSGWLEY